MVAWIHITTWLHNNARCVNPCHDFDSVPLPSVVRSAVRLVVRRPLGVRCARENKLFLTRLLTSEDECKWFWHQMIYFPGTKNTVSTQLYWYTYILMNPFFVFQLCTSTLTLCMLASWSREGAVFVVLSPSSHFTVGHVFPLSMSGANWRPLSLLWGSPPPSPNMAPLSTGSAHTPFSEHKTTGFAIFKLKNPRRTCELF